ncbi:MAG: RNA-binding S4 domain-containing protein [Clostridiales bacterium]|nr:RNA-binding S4 domain-containing protein [Clostridiales bacterium]
MRLDKYLKVSRIIKRRSIANDACDAGRISVNGRVQRASYAVKAGDIIEVQLGESVKKYKVTAISESPKKEDAAKMYETL